MVDLSGFTREERQRLLELTAKELADRIHHSCFYGWSDYTRKRVTENTGERLADKLLMQVGGGITDFRDSMRHAVEEVLERLRRS